MGILHVARRVAQRAGLEVRRFPQTNPSYRRVLLLVKADVDLVLDVGANRGQTGAELRRFGYDRDILSFEPTSAPYQELTRHAAADHRWNTLRIACGERDADVRMNLAANAGASSSLLPMHANCRRVAPNAEYVGEERVRMRRLDGLNHHTLRNSERIFLKADVQGYEKGVIAGASGIMNRIVGLQLEVSLTPIYEGSMLYNEAIDLARNLGFELVAFEDGFYDPRSGRLMWGDATFLRGQA